MIEVRLLILKWDLNVSMRNMIKVKQGRIKSLQIIDLFVFNLIDLHALIELEEWKSNWDVLKLYSWMGHTWLSVWTLCTENVWEDGAFRNSLRLTAI